MRRTALRTHDATLKSYDAALKGQDVAPDAGRRILTSDSGNMT